MAEQYSMTINGKPVKGSKTVGVINPATGKVFAQVPDCSKAELDQAFDAAQKAYPAWSRDIEVRRKVLNECAAALQANPEGLAKTLTMEQGKPLAKAAEELMGTAILVRLHRQPADAERGAREHREQPHRDSSEAAGRGRRDHSVELPVDARDVENRARAARRQHGGAEALAVYADHVTDARRDSARHHSSRRASMSSRAAMSSAR